MLNTHTWRRPKSAGHFVPVAIFLLLALLMQTVVSPAQTSNRPHYQLLWRIDGPGLKEPSYLFGTMHLTDKRVFEFSDSVLTALQSASAFAMEVDMDSMMTYLLAPGGPLQDTVNYMRTLLNQDEYRYVDSLVKEKTGSPLEQLKLKRLWFLEKLLIDEEGELEKEAGPARKPETVFLDAWLHQKATRLNKQVYSLEKIQNQLNLFSANVSEVQKEIFLWGIGYEPAGTDSAGNRASRLKARVNSLNDFVNLYYEGDLQKIAALSGSWEAPEDIPSLEARNKEMAANLMALLSKNSVFAAVGAAHLPGEEGLVSLLRKKGYSVTPVSAKFTGVARKQRQQLDSLKGYSLNRIANGYSVVLPGVPVVYPLPGINGKMFIGGNEAEAGFAFTMDIPQLATDRNQLVKSMISNMAAQDNAVLQRSYPITYRNVPGTEAVLLQKNLPFYIRVFIINNRAFLFMHSSEEADSSNRKNFFRSVRFYDIVRPETVYDTVYQPKLGYSVLLPSEHNHINTKKESTRPEEVYSALDNPHNISYIFRVLKMKRGYYNVGDQLVMEDVRAALYQQDTTVQLTDSVLVEKEGFPRYQFTYRHHNGFISRLHYIPRGNLAYCLQTTYDPGRTDSSYWQHFLGSFHLQPLQAKAPAVAFMPDDSSFTVAGPDRFTGGPLEEQSPAVDVQFYTSMDSTSYSLYMLEVDKYSRYYHREPDSILNKFVLNADTNLVITASRHYLSDGLPVYETDLKSRYTGLRFYRKAVVAGHTIYRLTSIVPEEVAGTGYVQQYFSSFHPGKKEQADTLRLREKKLAVLLRDLQSADTSVFHRASGYLDMLDPDSADIASVLSALNGQFPADTGISSARVRLLFSLGNAPGDSVIHAAAQLFTAIPRIQHRQDILRFLSGIASDSAIHTFLRLAPAMPADMTFARNIFAASFKGDSLYQQYLPAMVSTAARSESFLNAFVSFTSYDSIWRAPRFSEYKLEQLLPGATRLFKQQLDKWKHRTPGSDSSWLWERDLLRTGEVLSQPGIAASARESFRELLADTTMSLRALGARGLISQGIKVSDKILSGILADYNSSYSFITALKEQKQLSNIRHLLTQALIGRSYLTSYLSDDYEITAIEQVSRVKVQYGKTTPVSLLLYRYKTGESTDWEYVLNGPFEADPAKLNFEPDLIHFIEQKSTALDKVQLNAEAVKAYKEYMED